MLMNIVGFVMASWFAARFTIRAYWLVERHLSFVYTRSLVGKAEYVRDMYRSEYVWHRKLFDSLVS